MKNILFVGFTTMDNIEGKKYPGGAAGSMSINASTIPSLKPHLMTALSNDRNGKLYQSYLKKFKVDISLCTTNAPKLPTCTIKNPFSKGSKRIWKDNGIFPYLERTSLSKHKLKKFAAIILANAHPSQIKLIAKYLPKETPLVYIPGPQVVNQKDYLQNHLFPKTTLLFANQEEAEIIWRTKPLESGVELFIITLGRMGGKIYKKSSTPIAFPAAKTPQVVDPTGAGDCFALGFTQEFIKSKNIRKSINKGTKLAEKILTKKGGLLPNLIV